MTKTPSWHLDTFHPDVVIIGAGSAGSLLGARLSADGGRRVLLIEAGHEPTDPDIRIPALWPALQGRSYDRDYRTLPQPGTANRVHRWARGRVVGGSSVLHAMGYMRGHPADFDGWADIAGDRRWSWSGLLPAFEANEAPPDHASGPVAGLPLYLPDDEISDLTRAYISAGAALGLPRLQGHNSGRMIGVTPNTLNIRNGQRVTAADAWLTAEARARDNLRILTGCEVHHLEHGAGRVNRLAIIGPEGQFGITAETIILSAGALESPALLMRSGIGPKDVLAAANLSCSVDLPGVGRNLQDHLLGAGNLYASRHQLPPSRLQHSESMTYLRADGFTPDGRPEIVVGCGVAPIVSESFTAPDAGTAYSLLFGVTNPTSRGSLRITGGSPRDPLLIDPAYLQTSEDQRLFRAALDAARTIGGHPMLAAWRDHELLPGKMASKAEIDAFLAQAAITHHHPCGTCRMGRDTSAVVDAELRVQGFKNLYVVDASVMPTLTAGPIHAAVLAVAETFCRTTAMTI